MAPPFEFVTDTDTARDRKWRNVLCGLQTLRCRGVLNSAGASCSLDSCQRNKNRVEVTELEQPKLVGVDIGQFFLVYTWDNLLQVVLGQNPAILRACSENRNYLLPTMFRGATYPISSGIARSEGAYNPGLSGTLGSFSKLGWFLGVRTRMGLRPRLSSLSFVSHGVV
jgi:hypothetical protein